MSSLGPLEANIIQNEGLLAVIVVVVIFVVVVVYSLVVVHEWLVVVVYDIQPCDSFIHSLSESAFSLQIFEIS